MYLTVGMVFSGFQAPRFFNNCRSGFHGQMLNVFERKCKLICFLCYCWDNDFFQFLLSFSSVVNHDLFNLEQSKYVTSIFTMSPAFVLGLLYTFKIRFSLRLKFNSRAIWQPNIPMLFILVYNYLNGWTWHLQVSKKTTQEQTKVLEFHF